MLESYRIAGASGAPLRMSGRFAGLPVTKIRSVGVVGAGKDGSTWSGWDMVSAAQGVLMEQFGLNSPEALVVQVQRAAGAGVDLQSAAEDAIRLAGVRSS